jgi:uncharacterized protein with PIN domain
MTILAILIFIALMVWVALDYQKVNNEVRRCPNCKQIIKKQSSWKYSNKPITDKNGQKFNATIYKCPDCGFGWNHTYEINEDTT